MRKKLLWLVLGGGLGVKRGALVKIGLAKLGLIFCLEPGELQSVKLCYSKYFEPGAEGGVLLC